MKSRPILLSSMLGLVACGGPASSPITMPPIEVPAPVVPADDEAWSLLEGAMAPVTDIQWLQAELPQNQAPDAEHLDLWSQHADSLDAIESALLAPGLSIPPTPPFAEANTEDWETPEIRLQPLARAFAIRGWQKALAGDPAGGVSDLLTVLRLGQRLIDASEPLIPGTIGIAISNTGFDALVSILRGPAATRGPTRVSAAPHPFGLARGPPAFFLPRKPPFR